MAITSAKFVLLRQRSKQKGYSLVEVGAGIALMMMLASSVWSEMNDQKRSTDLTNGAGQLVTVNTAVQTYTSKEYSAILNGTVIAKPSGGTVANNLAPTIQDLKDLGDLSTSFSATPVFGGGYQITLSKVPAGCSGSACDVQSIVNFTTPVYKPGTTTVDEVGAGLMVRQIGSNGGRTTSATPGTITGYGAGWTATSPINKAGVVAILGGYNSSGYGVYFRIDGTSTMTGNANIGGHDLVNVGNMTATGTVTAANVQTATLNAGVGSITGLLTSGSLNTGAGTFSGPITTADNVTAAGNIAATGGVSGSALTPNLVVSANSPCSGYASGAIAKDANGMTLSCQSGSWSRSPPRIWSTQPGSSCNNPLSGQLSGEWNGLPTECVYGTWQYTNLLDHQRIQIGWFENGDSQESYSIGNHRYCHADSWQPNGNATGFWTVYDSGGTGQRNWYVIVKDGQVLMSCYD